MKAEFVRELIIDGSLGMTRAAVVEDGRLSEIHMESGGEAGKTQSVYYGRVQAIRASIRAAFIDIGLKQNAFLPLDVGQTLRCGDFLIVQGEASQATAMKGLRVTDRVTLAGRAMVLVPGEKGVYLSKKVKGEPLRARLLALGEKLCPPGCALILRTASRGFNERLLCEEAQELHTRWQEIERRAAGRVSPGLLLERETIDMRLSRELAGQKLSRIVVNDEETFQRLEHMRSEARLPSEISIEFFDERKKGLLLFDVFSLEAQIEAALGRRVWLPCGGYLVIDACEAMTVIDVNSGKMTAGRDEEETALTVNLEAAREVARQIRLREIGGIIIVDFIDMKAPEHREALLNCMREAAKRDRSPVTVEGITRLGLMEMTRRRGEEPLSRRLGRACPACGGAGVSLSAEEIARRALRDVRRKVYSGQRGPFLIRCGGACAEALLRMENPVDAPVHVLPAHGRHAAHYEIEQLGEGHGLPQGTAPLPERTDT